MKSHRHDLKAGEPLLPAESGPRFALLKRAAGLLLRLAFHIRIDGLDHYRAAGDRVVVVANHVSFLDGLLIACLLPGDPIFAVDTHIARRWWVRPFLRFVRTFAVDPLNPFAVKALVREVEAGNRLVIFPEGRITVTGGLMKIHEGPAMIADKAAAELLAIRIDGAERSLLSRLSGVLRRRLLPRISLAVAPPRRLDLPADLRGRRRRQLAGRQLYDMMSDQMFETRPRGLTLFAALLEAKAIHGGAAVALLDLDRRPATYRRLCLGALLLGRRLAAIAERDELVGLLLPNAIGAAFVFFALSAFGRVPAVLNFASGPEVLRAACRTAKLRTVVTSRRFAEVPRIAELIAAVEGEVRVLYLEDLQAAIGSGERLAGLLALPFARLLHRRRRIGSGDPAVILFTSGTEGLPKGVVLSHDNLLANRYQLAARLDFNPSDTVLNALPLYHSFGLTAGLLLPVLAGVRTFLYPTPLHYRIVPALAYEINATILFGTDTFLAGYGLKAHPFDFRAVRYVFGGAEAVREETRRVWSEKFGLRILEGYGVTETAPVLAVNTPLQYRSGSVGRLLPGIRATVEPVAGIAEGGRLHVEGPNVMLGYMRATAPGVLEPPPGGRHDTGDIVAADADGYLTILGRAKRFAKVAGEMVSLAAVEGLAERLWPGSAHAVVALPDRRRGEMPVLVTDRPDADRETLAAAARTAGLSALAVPRLVVHLDRLPRLGGGKIDYARVVELAAARAAAE